MNPPHCFSVPRWFGAGLLIVLLLSVSVLAQDAGPESDIRKVLKNMRDDRARYPTTEVPGRVRDITWRLLLGDLAGDKSLDLFSQTRQNLEIGLDALDRLTRDMLADPVLAKAVTQNTALVLRLDAVKLRKGALQAKLKLTAAKEQQRLSRLRNLNATYRQLTADMAAINTFFVLGDHDRVRALYNEVTRHIKALEDEVDDSKDKDKRDYYLFKDEPRLDPTEKSELQLIMKVGEPVLQDMITHFKSLQALTAYRLAVANAVPDGKLLDEASRLARELIDNKKANILTHYVQGLAQHEQGLLATAGKPLDAEAHKTAAPFFKQAQASYTEASKLAAGEVGRTILPDLKRRQAELASIDPFRDEANRQTLAGDPARAEQTLLRGLRVHRSGPLLIALAEAQIRAGQDLETTRDQIRDALADGLLDPKAPAAQLIAGRVELAFTWDRIAQTDPAKLTPTVQRQSLRQFTAARRHFNDVITTGDETQKQIARAYLALAYAYAMHLDPDTDADAAKDALGKLRGVVAALKPHEEKGTDLDRIAASEALVAARLAEGFLAIRFRPAYRADALLAFAAAADHQAKLRFRGASVKLFGSPVLSAMLSRPEGGGLKVAAQERQLRELVGRVAEGLAAQKLGSAKGASEQMKAALKQIDEAPSDPPVDASKLLDRSEENARATLRARARALAVQTLIAGGQSELALQEALKLTPSKLVVPRIDEVKAEDIYRAAVGISDPLVGYTLGLAVEDYAVSKEKVGSPRARALLVEARGIQKNTSDLIKKSPLFQERYPQVLTLNNEALKRLTDATSYLADATRLRKESRPRQAVQVLDEGLRRHPDDKDLHEELILAQIDVAELDTGETGKERMKQTLTEAETASKAGVLEGAGSYIALGELYEREGKEREAQAAYEKALTLSPTQQERIRAEARLAVLAADRDFVPVVGKGR